MPSFPEAKKVDPVYEIDGVLCRPCEPNPHAITAVVQGKKKQSLATFKPLVDTKKADATK